MASARSRPAAEFSACSLSFDLESSSRPRYPRSFRLTDVKYHAQNAKVLPFSTSIMAVNANRVPAWRKLGLVLKNEDQSGAAVPGPPVSHKPAQPGLTYDAPKATQHHRESPVEPAENGKSARLGKHKHSIQPAEEGGQTRQVAQDQGAQAAQPKGDLNYRKKQRKRKITPRKQESDEGAPSAPEGFAPTQSALTPEAFASTDDQPTLLASIETQDARPTASTTPQQLLSNSKRAKQTTPSTHDSRKSVAFTPDTKTTDGHSGQTLFKKWAADVKSSQSNSKAIETVEPALRSPDESSPASTTLSTPNRKKKDPSTYVSYLTQYFTDRDHWKFNKAKQNDVLDNALNIFRIPEEHSDALLEYISGLEGAAVIERLKEKCKTTLTEMNDAEAREASQKEALQERVTKEKKRRKVEGDMEGLLDHPHGDGYIRRLRRKRAKALLMALGRTVPILPSNTPANGINSMVQHLQPATRVTRKRKRRGGLSSDESSSEDSSDSSSGDESSGSDSESEDSDTAAEISSSLQSARSDESSSGGESSSGTDTSSASDSDSDGD